VKRKNCLLPDDLPSTQSDHDRAYRARQATKGIVRKSVLVPENRVAELHALLKKWRAAV
jgi:hypothetical protein